MNDFLREIIKRPHPAIVHFPISLYPISVVFLLIDQAQHSATYLLAAYGCFLIASLFLLPVAVTGLLDYIRLGPHSPKAHHLLQLHWLNGVVVTVLGLALGAYFWLHSPIADRSLVSGFLLSAVVLSLLVLAQGAIAALMIYQHKLGIDGETR